MSKIVKTKSSKSVIGELFSDFNINQSDFVSNSFRWIARAMAMMELEGYYKLKVVELKVQESRTPIPCDAKYLGAVLINGYGINTSVQSVSANGDIDLNSVRTGDFLRVPIRESFMYGTKFTNVFRDSDSVKGYINNNWLYLNIEEGYVYFLYFAPPCDSEGYAMIVDNEWVDEALPFYVIYRMFLSGYKHPVITMEYAEKKWNDLYPRARNSVNFPDVEEMQQITEMRTNPLLGDMGNLLFMY